MKDTNYQWLYNKYECLICGKVFNHQRTLYNHLINKHNFTKEQFKECKSRVKAVTLMLQKLNKEFNCLNCGKKLNISVNNGKIYASKYCRTCWSKQTIKEAQKVVNDPKNKEYIAQKRKQTMLERYNVDNYAKTKEYREKFIKTNLEKYGVTHYAKTEECKKRKEQTCLRKFSYKTNLQCEETKQKIKETNKKKFGYEHHLQNPEIYKKMLENSAQIKKYKNTDLTYQSTYELNFIDYCKELNIKIENGIAFNYKDNKNKLHTYYSDFYLPEYNLIVEIKSHYWLNKWQYKQEKINAVRDAGYNFLVITDKNYQMFNKII